MHVHIASLAALGAVSTASAYPGTRGEAFCVGLWGDMPYLSNGDVDGSVDKPANLVASMDASDIAFSVFNGDTKDGGSPCGYDSASGEATDSAGVNAYAKNLFDSSTKPVVYAVGDNEWTDCHRITNDNDGAAPLAMLDYIREELFHPYLEQGTDGKYGRAFGAEGADLRLRHQKGYVENARWVYGDVMFVTLHVPGSNNNNAVTEGEAGDQCGLSGTSTERTAEDCAGAVAEYTARNAANLKWINKSFQKVKEMGLMGVAITMQANMGFDDPNTEEVEPAVGYADGSNGFSATLKELWEQAMDFDGQVLLMHGDSHLLRIDTPFSTAGWDQGAYSGPALDNFTRCMAMGSPTINWVKVCVDPAGDSLFTFSTVVVEENH